MSIPKKIHYCWFGENPKNELAERCIKSWKKYCPDYEIVEWNESNFDIHINKYVEEAYNAKKYAFVSDVARLHALCAEGGVYMDTDVELVKSLEDLEKSTKAYIGFQDEKKINTGLIASEKDNEVIKKFLSYYDNKSFVKEDGTFDTTTNVDIITNMLLEMGLILNNTFQKMDNIDIYQKEYFCPIDYFTGKKELTKNTVAIHWFSASWLSNSGKVKAKITKIIYKIFGKDSLNWLKRLLKKENVSK
jgi:Mannosyltransferase OCH1 and related enzymes